MLTGASRLIVAIAYVLMGSMLIERPVAVSRSSTRQQSATRDLDISCDRQTRASPSKVSLEDPYGHVIPNLRREHCAVYEDGVKQTNATVDVERASITMAVLLEGGGRYQQLNAFLRRAIPIVARPLLQTLRNDDKLAVFAYMDHVETLLTFDQRHGVDDSVRGLDFGEHFFEAHVAGIVAAAAHHDEDLSFTMS